MMKVAVLTTSYPRSPRGRRRTVHRGRGRAPPRRGIEVEVVSPASSGTSGSPTATGSWAISGATRCACWRCRRCSSPTPAPPAGRPAAPSSCTPTGSSPVRSRCSRQAVRRPAVGHRRRARRPRAPPRPSDPPSCASDDLRIERARRRGALARRGRGSRDSERGRRPAPVERPEAEPPEVLFVGGSRGEGDPRSSSRRRRDCRSCVAGDGPLRDRVPRRARLRGRTTSSIRSTGAPPSSPVHPCARASASRASRRWHTAYPSSRRGRRTARPRRRRRDRAARAAG